ncbi:MAG TPA: isocitrate/isopropylmalate dehydrogenase family protein [Candidatus Limnocylindrales bacterium]|nr:isocitrate/isopropylmalate dehydrogenase family protein [Candidatus Limnocylindrales bacterium]
MLNLCVIEGDGIGPEVVPAAVRVLQAVLPEVRVHVAEAGWGTFQRRGTSLPADTLALARECGAVLYGAAASPSYGVDGYQIPGVRLRRELACYANLRPTRYLPVPTARKDVDLIVVRENTEDMYIGHERTEQDGEIGISEKVITRAATTRVARRTYELARATARERVTIVHKASVLVQTDGLFRRVALEIADDYPDVATDELLVDTAAYWMVKDPLRFDVLLAPNQYGDILSDMAAAWGGGLGLAPSLNIGDGVAMAEPVHGCAPDIAGQNIANPTATILSVAMLLRYHWILPEQARRIESAIRSALTDGMHTGDIYPDHALTTTAFTDEVIKRL